MCSHHNQRQPDSQRLFPALAAAALFLFLAPGIFLPKVWAKMPSYTEQELSLQGTVLDLFALSSERRHALIAAIRTGLYPHRQMSLVPLIIQGDKLVPGKPLELDPSIALADSFASKNGDELYLLGTSQLSSVKLLNDRLLAVTLKANLSTAVQPEPGDLPRYRFIGDIDADGQAEAIIPLLSGVSILRLTGDSASALSSTTELPSKHYLHAQSDPLPVPAAPALRMLSYLPQLTLADVNADHLIDLVYVFEDEVWIFPQLAPGKIADKAKYFFLDQLTEDERRIGDASLVPQLADLNKDGACDLLVNKISGSIIDQNLRLMVYFGGAGFYTAKGAIILERQHVSSSAFALTQNPALPPALVLAQLDTGLFALANSLLRKSVSVDFSLFPFDVSKLKPAEKPSFTSSMRFKIDFTAMDVDGFLPTIQADFNGDGLHDALVGNASDQTSIYPGLLRGGFSEKAELTLDGPNSKHVSQFDLNADGCADLAFAFPNKKNRGNKVRVLLSKHCSPAAAATEGK